MPTLIEPINSKQLTDSIKVHKWLTEMRTNLKLLDRPTAQTDRQKLLRLNAKKEVRHSLDNLSVIYPPSMLELGLSPSMPLAKKLELFPKEEPEFHVSDNEVKFVKSLQKGIYQRRKQEWRFRIGEAAWQMNALGWYPFFVTLTLDQKKLNLHGIPDKETFWRETNHFQNWLKKIAGIVAAEFGRRPPHKTGEPRSNYLQYVGVLEHGKSAKHHHMHVLMWLRDVPGRWKKCPNARINDAKKRVSYHCDEMESYWKFDNGKNSPCLYWRSTDDIWQRKHGFVHPTTYRGGKQKLLPVTAAGNYLVKYLLKGNKEWNHRIKATRNIGLMRLYDVLMKAHPKRLEALTWRPKNYQTLVTLQQTHSVPAALVRRLAKPLNFCRNLETLKSRQTLRLENYESYANMLSSVKDGARPWEMASAQLYDWLGEHLPEPDGYCEKRLIRAHNAFTADWPKMTYKSKTPITGNQT